MTDLVREISSLQPDIGGDVFINRPSELAVKFPRDEGQQDRAECEHARRSDEAGFQVPPNLLINEALLVKTIDRFIHLIHLHGGINHHTEIVNTYPNDLNRILKP